MSVDQGPRYGWQIWAATFDTRQLAPGGECVSVAVVCGSCHRRRVHAHRFEDGDPRARNLAAMLEAMGDDSSRDGMGFLKEEKDWVVVAKAEMVVPPSVL